MNVVILLLCHGFFLQQGFKTTVFPFGIFHVHTGFFYTCIGHLDACIGCHNTASCGFSSFFCTGMVGFGLRKTEAKFCIFYHNKGIAFLHPLKLFESNLFDETLHTGVLWSNMLTHTSIICIFHTTEMTKVHHNDNCSHYNHSDNDGIINVFLDILHFYLMYFKVVLQYISFDNKHKRY